MGRGEKLAWFPFYVTDWMTDEKVIGMTLAEQGAFLKLLCLQWIEGSVSSDVAKLERYLGTASQHSLAPASEHVDLVALLQSCFPKHPTLARRLANPRMLQVAEEQRLESEKRRAAGRKGGYSKAKARLQPGSTEPEPKTKTTTNTAAGGPDGAFVREHLEHDAEIQALDGLIRAAEKPEYLMATIRALGPGGIESLGDWGDVGRALRDCAAAPGKITANFLRGCVVKAKRDRIEKGTAWTGQPDITPAEEVRKMREAAEREDAA